MAYLSYRIPMGVGDKCVVTDSDGKDICSLWGSIQSFSFLFNGAEMNYTTNNETVPGATFLSFIFYIVLLFIAVYSVSITIVSIQQIKLKESLVANYWVPLYIHISLMQDLSSIFACQKPNQSRQYEQKQSCSACSGNASFCSGFEKRLGSIWDYMLCSFDSIHDKNSKWWSYQRSLGSSPTFINSVLCIRLVSILIIPLWVVIGLLSLGILWPPQCRRWLLTWSNYDNQLIEQERDDVNHPKIRRNAEDSLNKMKCMVFDRFDDIHAELDYIKRRGLS